MRYSKLTRTAKVQPGRPSPRTSSSNLTSITRYNRCWYCCGFCGCWFCSGWFWGVSLCGGCVWGTNWFCWGC